MAKPFTTHPRLAALAALAVIAAGTGVAFATPSGTNGRIAFRRYADAKQTSGAIFTLNTDGSDVRQVTHPPARSIDDQPDWSSDGRRLVFCRLNSKGSCAITTVNADGSGLQSLTSPCDAL